MELFSFRLLFLKNIPFPISVNARTITSTNDPSIAPVRVGLASGSTNAILQIGNLVIGSISKSNLQVPLTLTPGTRYTVTLNIKDFSSDGIIVGGLMWAPANLTASKGNNNVWTYSFLSDQDKYTSTVQGGDYWLGGKVIPGRDHIKMHDGNPWPSTYYDTYPSGDPCTKVSPEWRTPTSADFKKLMNAGAVSNGNPGIPGTYGPSAIKGRYFGPSTLTVAPTNIADQRKYVFLAFTGLFMDNDDAIKTNDGAHYWTKNVLSGDNYDSLHVMPGYSSLGGFFKVDLNPIRCVKDIPTP